MACIYGDQPLRVQLSKGGVVHAGAYQKYGGFQRAKYDPATGVRSGWEQVPVQDRITIVCRRWRYKFQIEENQLVPNTEEITCKSCMKLMGLIEEPLSMARYVIVKPSTGEFYKNTNSRCTPWSDSINDAFLWKQEHTADDKCKYQAYKLEDGRIVNWKEWADLGRPKFERIKLYYDDMEVKKVKITLIE